MHMRQRLAFSATLVALTISIAACGGDDSGDSATTVAPATTAAAATTAAPAETSAAPTTAGDAATTVPGTDVATTVAAADSGPNTPEPQPLAERTKVTASIPFRGIEPYATLLLADALGEFDKENLDVEIVEAQTNNAVVLLQQGDVDFMPAAVSAGLYNAIAGGADIHVVGGGIGFSEDNHQGYYARKGALSADGTFDVCSLKGKNVSTGSATGLGSPAVVELSALLATCDLTLKDVNIVPQGGADLFAAMDAGAVDVGNLADPFWQQAAARGDLLVAPFTQPNAGYYMGKIRTEHPEVAEAIVRALVRTTRTYLQGDYRADPTVRAAIIESMGITDAQLQGPASIVFDPDFEFPVEVVAPVEQVWLEVGGILNYTEPLPVDQYFDDSIRQAVVG
jgi:NitT/TauT family transport system substrate-binding protein